MKEILLTSSALILALLALRRLFRKTISRQAQYALWGLVLLRLLVPFSLPAADFSLLTAAEPMVKNTEALYVRADRTSARGQNGAPVMGPPNAPYFAMGPATEDNTYTFQSRDALGSPVVVQADYQRQFRLEDILPPVWYAGCAVMAVRLVLSNLLFWRKLRKYRVPYAVENARLPVYLVERGLPSPCLFGLFRPAVYLTPAALASPDSLRHVLAHEETHARHLDPLWSLLRGVCLVVYWFDPLVWWAALASRTDCELACDEGALRRLGEAERVSYGRTLLALIPVRKAPANPLLSATTMTADKRRLMDRIARIAENRKHMGTALFAAVALAALVCAVTFTGARTADTPQDEPADQAVPDWEPIHTIPLDGLEPYEPKVPEMVPLAYDYLEMLDSPEDLSHILGNDCLLFFRNDEGRVFAGVQNMLLSSWPPAFWSFVPGESGTWSTSFFRDLMGHDGFCITITDSEGPFYRRNDYYYLNEDGQPVHLARVDGWPELIDLDGDGQKELVSQAFYSGEFYFQRDGKHYRADLHELLKPFWPEDTIFTCDSWDAASRSLPFQAWTHAYSNIAGASHREYRTLYFDGENLLVYNEQRHFDDHMVGWFDEYTEVKEAALEAVRQEFDAAGAPYDDWRVMNIDGAVILELAGQSYRVWRVSCEFHSQELQDMPETNAQDRWADPFGPERLYLIFRDDSQDEFHTNLTYLFSMRQYLWPTEAQLPERLAQVTA